MLKNKINIVVYKYLTLATGSLGLLRVLNLITVACGFNCAHASVGFNDNSLNGKDAMSLN